VPQLSTQALAGVTPAEGHAPTIIHEAAIRQAILLMPFFPVQADSKKLQTFASI
jgi:hypothetical protein